MAIPDHIIHVPIYPVAVKHFYSLEALYERARANGYVGPTTIHDHTAGHAFFCEDADDFLIYLPRQASWQIVSHECLHIAWFILEAVGVEVDWQNHEALAYLQQWLSDKLWQIVTARDESAMGLEAQADG